MRQWKNEGKTEGNVGAAREAQKEKLEVQQRLNIREKMLLFLLKLILLA